MRIDEAADILVFFGADDAVRLRELRQTREHRHDEDRLLPVTIADRGTGSRFLRHQVTDHRAEHSAGRSSEHAADRAAGQSPHPAHIVKFLSFDHLQCR